MVNIQSVHHDPQIWPDPLKYNPYRFCSDSSSAAPELEPFTFLPFIDGPRNCLGQYLALLESKMVISLLVQRYNLTLEHVDGNADDPRHRYIVPIIPEGRVDVSVSRKA